MSPERLRSEQYGRDADIWSLGIILLECLSGVHPFRPKKEVIKLDQIKSVSSFDARTYV